MISRANDRPGTAATDADITAVIHDVARQMRHAFDQRIRDLGLTQSQWRAIVHLSRNEGLHQAALAELLEIKPISLTRLLDRMAAAGWVERRADPADRRAQRLFLTSRVEPIRQELWKRADALRRECLAGVPETERQSLYRALSQIKANLMRGESRPAPRSGRKASRQANAEARR